MCWKTHLPSRSRMVDETCICWAYLGRSECPTSLFECVSVPRPLIDTYDGTQPGTRPAGVHSNILDGGDTGHIGRRYVAIPTAAKTAWRRPSPAFRSPHPHSTESHHYRPPRCGIPTPEGFRLRRNDNGLARPFPCARFAIRTTRPNTGGGRVGDAAGVARSGRGGAPARARSA